MVSYGRQRRRYLLPFDHHLGGQATRESLGGRAGHFQDERTLMSQGAQYLPALKLRHASPGILLQIFGLLVQGTIQVLGVMAVAHTLLTPAAGSAQSLDLLHEAGVQ